MMPRWIELADQASRECQVTTAVHWLSSVDLMTWLSEAVFEYQKVTSATRREVQITLDPDSADGAYALDPDFKTLDIITYAPPGSTSPSFIPVRIINYDAFTRQVASDTNGAVASSGLGGGPNPLLPQTQGHLYAAISYGKIHFWPFRGAEGVVSMRCLPNRKPYSPLNTVEWATYGGDPYDAMVQFGPPDEFAPAIIGIKDYCKAKILEVHPGGLKQNLVQYQIAMASFERTKMDMRRNSNDFAGKTKPKYNMGGLR